MRTTILAFLVSLCVIAGVQAAEVAGVRLDDKTRVGDGPELVLNGAGLRTKVIFKVYVAGLYLPEKKTTSAEVIALKGSKRVLLSILRDLSAEQLIEALNDGLKSNSSTEELARLKPQIDALNAIMLAAKEATKGSIITFDYVPGAGTRVSINNEAKGAPIPGEDFYSAVLRIWIGDKPVEDSLKKAMLGAG